jgi:hypothetical protein
MGVSGQHHAPSRALPAGKGYPVTIGQEAGWPTQRLGEKSSASVGDQTPVVQSVVSHYTDWATPARILYVGYIKLKLCVCVCSLIAREWTYWFAPNLACLFLETRKRFCKGQNSRKSVLSLIPGEGGSCSSKTKHDRRTAPRPKWFFSKRRFEELRPRPRKNCPGFESRWICFLYLGN